MLVIATPGCTNKTKISEETNLKKISKKIKNLDATCLVVFDVDQTLITPTDALVNFSGMWQSTRLYYLYVKATRDFFLSNLEWYFNTAFFSANYKLVDKKTPLLIRRLQRKKVKVIALTSCPTGYHATLGDKKIEDWRIDQLKRCKINFSRTSPYQKNILFPELSTKHPPLFKKGILFANRSTRKGELLREFLYRISWKPRLIIFVDDDHQNVQSVVSAMEKEKIECIGLHYTKAKHSFPTIDYTIAEKQIAHLVKNHHWLHDKEIVF